MARGMVERDWFALARDLATALGAAGAVFALSYANGGYDITTRAYAGISGWWLLGVGAAVGLGAVRTRLDRFAFWALGLLTAFAVWTVISAAWTPDADRTFQKFDQVSLYVAMLAIAIMLGRIVSAVVVVSGVALAVSAIAGVALASRLFPSTFGVKPSTILYSLNTRLSFPLGYWNGLGIEVALAYPLLLALMTSRRSRAVSALAAVPPPILAADMYLTSSRGAFAAVAIALIAYVAITPKRWAALAGLVVAGAGGAVAVATLQPRHELVNGDMTNPLAIQQGHHSALVIGITCVVGALVWLGLWELGRRVPAPPRLAGQALAVLFVVLVIAGIVASHPVRRFHDFTNSNFGNYGGTSQTFIEQHLLSSSGSGRWQFWGAAISQYRAHPTLGGGAGSWQYWWLQHQTAPIFSQSAHSLYLEALGELGVLGCLLILGAVLVALVGAVRAALALASAEVAAAAACAVAFFAAAAYDWVWELAGITVVGLGMVGVALGASPSGRLNVWRRESVIRPVVAFTAVAAIIGQFIVLSATLHLDKSYAAARAGNAAGATSQALAAKALEPWAASPYLQLGELAEAEGHFDLARRWIADAISRSKLDWRLWTSAAVADTYRGKPGAAAQEAKQACALYPSNLNPSCSTTTGG